MPEYISVPIETDPESLAQDAFDYITNKIPNWLPSEGNLETIILGAISQMAAENRDLASDVPTTIFRWFGATLLGVPPIDAQPAQVLVTFQAINTDGYTVPAGTIIGLRDSNDELVPFELANDVIILPGLLISTVNDGQLIAVEPGAAASGLPGPAEMIDALSFIAAVTVTGGASSGGVDAEEDDAYMARLVAELQLLSPRPILARDFAVMARRVGGVFRATAIDGYNPATQTYNNEKYVAVAVVDANGNALSAPVKASVDALLQAEREINFVVNVIDPTITNIDVTFAAISLPDFDPAAVELAAEQAVRDYLNPATWGTNPIDDTEWLNTTVVRYLELAEVINRVEGINYITTLTLAVAGGGQAAANVTLTGAAPLANDGAIVGTVTAS